MLGIRRCARRLAVTVIGMICANMLARGEAIAQSSTGVDSIPFVHTAAEDLRSFSIYGMTGLVTDDGRQRVPESAFDTVMKERAKTWITALQKEKISGIQLDPMGQLYISVDRDSLAKQQFSRRLATPGVSVADSAYTLLVAIGAFSGSGENSRRMQTALQYLAELDALPPSVIDVKFKGHITVAMAYYAIGQGELSVVHIRHAFALLPSTPFERRDWSSIGSAFTIFADIISGMPGGRAQLDAVGERLLGYTTASQELIAKNPIYERISRRFTRDFQKTLRLTSYLGRPAAPIVANYWWNVSEAHDSQPRASGLTTKMLNDGKIRIMEFGHYNCGWCLKALPMMERIRASLPSNAEAWYVTIGHGMWGITACTPQQEADHLKHYYVDRKKYGLPTALWIGPREADIDGGGSQQPSPTWDAYKITGTPTFIITDGAGIVRHIQVGYAEAIQTRTIQYLIADAARRASAATPGI